MNQSSIAIIIYIIGVVIGAIFLDIWGAETSIKKGLMKEASGQGKGLPILMTGRKI